MRILFMRKSSLHEPQIEVSRRQNYILLSLELTSEQFKLLKYFSDKKTNTNTELG